MYRINLKGHKKSENDVKKLKWEKSVICKRLPDSRERREAYRSEELFHNEVIFYNEIIPALLSFQKLKTNETFNAVPKCYLAQSDLLMLGIYKFTMFFFYNFQFFFRGFTCSRISNAG